MSNEFEVKLPIDFESEQDYLNWILSKSRGLEKKDIQESIFFIPDSKIPFSFEFLDEVKINDKFPVWDIEKKEWKPSTLAIYHGLVYCKDKRIGKSDKWAEKWFTSLSKEVRSRLDERSPLKDKRFILTKIINPDNIYDVRIDIKELPKKQISKSTKTNSK